MLILAFETSAKAAGAALHDGKKLLAEAYQNTGLTHSQTLMVMAEDTLNQCGKTAAEVEAVAVAAGPGSFTGVRIGVAAATPMRTPVKEPGPSATATAETSSAVLPHCFSISSAMTINVWLWVKPVF